eukprot:Em0894g4a
MIALPCWAFNLTTPSSHERHALGVTPTFALAHDYMADTTYGPTLRNEQLFQSGPKCPGVNIEYLGDPLLQPIRSYENPTLVRSLYQLSCVLNTKLAPYLAALNTSKGLVSNLLLQLLAPPPPLQIPVSRHSARFVPCLSSCAVMAMLLSAVGEATVV